MPRPDVTKLSAQMRFVWPLCLALLAVLILTSGLGQVEQAHEVRALYSEMGQLQREQDALLEEHSRLLLERGALSSMQKVEVVAQGELDMLFPDRVRQIQP